MFIKRVVGVLLALVVMAGLGGCDKRSLFQSIMNHERESAKLAVKMENLPYGKVVYLTNGPAGSELPSSCFTALAARKTTGTVFRRN